MDSLGERLKKLRLNANMTQQQVADYIGKSKGNVSGYENGAFDPSASTIIKLAECFDISTDYLLTGKEPTILTEGEEEVLKIIRPLCEKDKFKVTGVIENYLATSRHKDMPDGEYISTVFDTSSGSPTRPLPAKQKS